jgi:hypothetical protein
MGEVLRGKALALLMERAAITDASGRPVDLDTLGRAASGEDGEAGQPDDDATDVEVPSPDDSVAP